MSEIEALASNVALGWAQIDTYGQELDARPRQHQSSAALCLEPIMRR